MKSLKEIYRIGYGPSSSHTMGPTNAAEIFLSHNTDCQRFKVTLYGSLAATGKGHLTDVAVESIFHNNRKEVEIIWEPKTFLPACPSINGQPIALEVEHSRKPSPNTSKKPRPMSTTCRPLMKSWPTANTTE